MVVRRGNRLRVPVRFILFITSYFPLFLLIIINQFSKAPDDLSYGGIGIEPVNLFLKYYGVSFLLLILILIGCVGLIIFIQSMLDNINSSGVGVNINQLENRNSESIAYVGTYIIPFLFNDYSNICSVISLCILLIVIYFIYIQSSLIMINPILNIFYSLYEIEFVDASNKSKKGMLIIKERYLCEGDQITMINIGHKLYFGKMKGEDDAK